MQARRLLWFERRVAAAIYRSVSDDQNTHAVIGTHGIVATGKLGHLLGGLFVEWHVLLLGGPEAVKQHSQLAGYCNDGLALGLLATSGG
jgi:hypothetical protein